MEIILALLIITFLLRPRTGWRIWWRQRSRTRTWSRVVRRHRLAAEAARRQRVDKAEAWGMSQSTRETRETPQESRSRSRSQPWTAPRELDLADQTPTGPYLLDGLGFSEIAGHSTSSINSRHWDSANQQRTPIAQDECTGSPLNPKSTAASWFFPRLKTAPRR